MGQLMNKDIRAGLGMEHSELEVYNLVLFSIQIMQKKGCPVHINVVTSCFI